MQPLNIGILQPYKHWHNIAIQNAMTEVDLDYSTVRFREDLTRIRDNTFKKSTIQSAFEKCGMYPVNPTKRITQLREFVLGSSKIKSQKAAQGN